MTDPMKPSGEAVEAALTAHRVEGTMRAALTAAYAIDLAPVLERAKWAEDRVQFLVSLDAKFGPKSCPAQRPSREDVARALCRHRATSQCAAICLSRFASDNRDGKCPDAVRVFGEDADAVLALFPNSPAPPSEPLLEHGWRPISEAPDRTDVLVARRDKLGNPLPPIVAGLYDNGDTTGWSSFDSQDTWIEGRATYWQPLPAPPAPASEEGR